MKQIRYEDWRPMVAKHAWTWSRKSGLEFEDLMAEGNLAFCEATRSYDPSRSKFSTWLWRNLQVRFGNLNRTETVYRKDFQRQSNSAYRETDDFELASPPDQEKRAVFADGLRKDKRINGDETVLIGLVFSPPADFIDGLILSGNPRTTKRALTRYVRDRYGWTYPQAWKALANIKSALAEI